MIELVLIIIGFSFGLIVGGYMGRRDILKDFGMTWADYRKHLNGRRPH